MVRYGEGSVVQSAWYGKILYGIKNFKVGCGKVWCR